MRTKQEIIAFIVSLPETARINVDYTVPEPTIDNDEYLMELGRKKTDYMLRSENKHSVSIHIEYNQRVETF